MTDTILSNKLRSFSKKLNSESLREALSDMSIDGEHQVELVQGIAASIKGTHLEGAPFAIALLKAKLLPDKAIAEELNMPLKAVRRFSQVDGFQTLMNQLMPAIWSDLILAAQRTLMHHIAVEKNLEASKWLLEVLGQVASNRPLTNNTHQTLILNPGSTVPGNPKQLADNTLSVENLAAAMMQRLTENHKTSTGSSPPITLSH